ncbi:alpha/beta hydrolase family esterase [Microbacterium sp. P04]|uniref:alpha/beta hydrolase family esterase n=1 Tax=Microbacterium sp. P04 TaxID=3366947 RepID=UPI003745D49E
MKTTVSAAGRTRTLTVVGEPDGPSGRALVLVFHGSKQDGETHRRFIGGVFDRLAAEDRAVVAYLDGYRGNWNDARVASSFPARVENVDDVAFARATIDLLAESHGIDRSAVVAYGYSNGGQMVFHLLHEPDELIAGAVVVAATMPDRDGFLGAFSETSDRPVPVALIAGTADTIVPFNGGRMAWWARALFKVDGTALSAPATAEYFARRNGLTAAPAMLLAPTGAGRRSGTQTEMTAYREEGRAPVTLYTVRGGGHTVPGPKAAPFVLGRTGDTPTIDGVVSDMLEALKFA